MPKCEHPKSTCHVSFSGKATDALGRGWLIHWKFPLELHAAPLIGHLFVSLVHLLKAIVTV